MAFIIKPCSNCKKSIKMYVGQYFNDENSPVNWYISYSCPFCETEIEQDESGILPDEIKKAILAQEGTWILDVQEKERRAIIALKLIKKALNLSLDDAMKIKKSIPGEVIEGTKIEIKRIKQILDKHKLHCSAIKK